MNTVTLLIIIRNMDVGPSDKSIAVSAIATSSIAIRKKFNKIHSLHSLKYNIHVIYIHIIYKDFYNLF